MRKFMLSLALPTVMGCAAVQIPPDRLEGTEASIRGAEVLGAAGVPKAKLYLLLAREQAATARKMAADGDSRALLVLARADADAELALGLAREVEVHAEAMRASDELKAVQARGTP